MPNVVAPITLPDGAVNKDVLFDYTTGPTGTNPLSANDHLGGAFPSGRVTIPAGQTAASITISPNPDTTVEPDETGLLTVTPFTSGVTIEPATRVYTFVNDDSAAPSNIYGPAATADTGTNPYLTVGSVTKYKLATTVDNTGWQFWFGGEANTGRGGYYLAQVNSSHLKIVEVAADGTESTSNQMTYQDWNGGAGNTEGGVDLEVIFDRATAKLDIKVGGFAFAQRTLYTNRYQGPYTRFLTGAAARPAVTIAAVS